MNVRFNSIVKHNRLVFSPGIVYDVQDATAAQYFVAAGWAAETSDPADYTIGGDEVGVDPDTVFGEGPSKGQKVLPGGGN